MKACAKCGAYIPDESRFCPSCGAEQGVAAAAPPPGGPEPVEGPPPEEAFDRAAAEGRIRTLGILYIVAGGLLLLATLISFVGAATGETLRTLEEVGRENPEFGELVERVKDLLLAPWFLTVEHLAPFSLGVFYVWTGIRLRDLRGRTAALVAAVLMVVLFPCQAGSCCCCVSVPLGVYALFLLTGAGAEAVLRE